eukprot:gnl/Spiro4/25062_TR12466_c0_g1_i1.p1 gnl/Spiro4/25062_TR12466_c0_g1~~gnl/Spiro4/25062_TR12466_c0_g1_i1.p1  ORF type:complete len:309 (+),score=58.41 gnl/Spiro4/25062_TR12466_c0_g1_i1:107-928(+)
MFTDIASATTTTTSFPFRSHKHLSLRVGRHNRHVALSNFVLSIGLPFDFTKVEKTELCDTSQLDYSTPSRWAYARFQHDTWHVEALMVNLNSVGIKSIYLERLLKESNSEEEALSALKLFHRDNEFTAECYRLELTGSALERKVWALAKKSNCFGATVTIKKKEVYLFQRKYIELQNLSKEEICASFDNANTNWAHSTYNYLSHNCMNWVAEFRKQLSSSKNIPLQDHTMLEECTRLVNGIVSERMKEKIKEKQEQEENELLATQLIEDISDE